MVNVYFYSELQEILGKEHFQIPAKSLAELLRIIFTRYEEKLQEKLFLENNFHKINPGYTIMINDQPVDFQKVKELKLKNTDSVHFIPPIVGGCLCWKTL